MQGRGCPWHCLWLAAGRRPMCSAMAYEVVSGAQQAEFVLLQLLFDSVKCQWEDAANAHERGPVSRWVAQQQHRGP